MRFFEEVKGQVSGTVTVSIPKAKFQAVQQAQITQDALSVLQILLRSIPSFWNVKELVQVIGLHLDLCGSPNTESTMAPLVKAIAKRAPPKTVLLTMNELWPPLHHSVCGCCVRLLRLLHGTV